LSANMDAALKNSRDVIFRVEYCVYLEVGAGRFCAALKDALVRFVGAGAPTIDMFWLDEYELVTKTPWRVYTLLMKWLVEGPTDPDLVIRLFTRVTAAVGGCGGQLLKAFTVIISSATSISSTTSSTLPTTSSSSSSASATTTPSPGAPGPSAVSLGVGLGIGIPFGLALIGAFVLLALQLRRYNELRAVPVPTIKPVEVGQQGPVPVRTELDAKDQIHEMPHRGVNV
jgi:hypothetical protein